MKKIHATLHSQLNKKDVVNRLHEHVRPEGKLRYLYSNKFLMVGTLDEGHFKLQTIEAPPIELDGTLKATEDQETTITLTLKADSMRSAMLGLLLALLYPFLFIFFILGVYYYPSEIQVYLYPIPVGLLIFYGSRFYVSINYPEPDPNAILDALAEITLSKVEAFSLKEY